MKADAIARVLAVALQEDGVREEGGNNRGPRVEEYLRRVHWMHADPWCAAFVGWCGDEALGGDWPLPLVPGTGTLYDFAHTKGIAHQQPAAGDVFLTWSQERHSYHTGFIVAVQADGTCETIEGNTNDGGSHNGDGVYRQTRAFHPADRFIRWADLLPED